MYNRNMSFTDKLIKFCLEQKLVIILLLLFLAGWGIMVAPFDWKLEFLHRMPVAVDAIPDIGENQQIVFTEWSGRSPQDVEDQISYPLTVSLLGIPGVKTVRTYSMFGFSSIYIIFQENIDFYWSRSRILEKLNSLSPGSLPEGVQPMLGPDATALGQVFWYNLEGQDEKGNPTEGWNLGELRTVQDWCVRYALLSAGGISEVASIGGFAKEYQVDVDPDAMRASNVTIDEVFNAVKMANIDVGARTIEVNKVEYVIRGIGFIKKIDDIENSVIKVNDNIPVYVKNVANVTEGPMFRRGAIDKQGAQTVGGVVVVRFGANPLEAIKNVKKKIAEISPGLPKKILPDGTVSQVKIVPFYDRTGLIYETLGTLHDALYEEILITIIVILIMVMHLRSSILISGLLPLAVLICFIFMKIFNVSANIVALSGIAIAIGTMVDMGIIICENILKHLDEASPGEKPGDVIFRAVKEVAGAVITAVSTTIVSFLPVFTMEGPEGKLFKPLAFTKTFALAASIIVAITIIPPFAQILFTGKLKGRLSNFLVNLFIICAGILVAFHASWWIGSVIILIGLYYIFKRNIPERINRLVIVYSNYFCALIVAVLLADHWLPLGPQKGFLKNFIFVTAVIGSILAFYELFRTYYRHMLKWCLIHKKSFLAVPVIMVILGMTIWLGFNTLFGWFPQKLKEFPVVSGLIHVFPGLGKEFMPPLDEGSFLFMPTTMPHVSIGEALDILQKQDIAIHAIPEVESVVGKIGRSESALDPAPISMIETIINYKPQFLTDENGRYITYKFDPDEIDLFRNIDGNPVCAGDGKPYYVRGKFIRDKDNRLIIDPRGSPFRLWRPELDTSLNKDRTHWTGIKSTDDVWKEIIKAADVPGTTSAPKLQPIAARQVMLQSGMRAPMGVKIKGPDIKTIQKVGFLIEKFLKEVPSIEQNAVVADRIVGLPYLEIFIDRKAIARYGIKLNNIQDTIETAIGGKTVTTTVEGRERYPVRVRYLRELRDTIESVGKILVPAPDGAQIPLVQLADIRYVTGPDMIKSEDTFLTGYVLFDKKPEFAEVDVVNEARNYLQYKIDNGELLIPPGVSYNFSGSYENQVRSEKRLRIILPLALFVIFLILYFQFRVVSTTFLVFCGIIVAWAGGFILIWLYAQPWFLNFHVFGIDLRDLFSIHPINLSVAIWVGFLALFGIASDDGVVMATYLNESFASRKPDSIAEIREATISAGLRRIRPCLMTTATTVLALLPVLTSTGRGSDIMVPMAIPSFGGMVIEIITMLIVPVIYCLIKETELK